MENGQVTNFMVEGNSSLKMVLTIKEVFDMDQLKAKEDTFIIMVVLMKDKFKMIKLTVRDFILTLFSIISIMVNGKMMFQMGMVSKNFLMDHITREIFTTELKKVLDIMSVSQEFMKVISKEVASMDKELSHILTVEFIKGDGQMD